ncbi:hypothetical protein U724_04985 [Pseudomonas chlororaphis subsp. aurantiaca PB-St2]|nr:hypothetical protein U724_04985 [Pseudomonas chlororaphis subsp. aurantiaca PB-St2]
MCINNAMIYLRQINYYNFSSLYKIRRWAIIIESF